MAICKTCKGTGKKQSSNQNCSDCGGSGDKRDRRCKNCVWEFEPNGGCNTEWGSPICKLNRKDKKEDARTEEKKKIENLLLDVSKIKGGATSDVPYAEKIKELMKARRRLIQLGRKKV